MITLAVTSERPWDQRRSETVRDQWPAGPAQLAPWGVEGQEAQIVAGEEETSFVRLLIGTEPYVMGRLPRLLAQEKVPLERRQAIFPIVDGAGEVKPPDCRVPRVYGSAALGKAEGLAQLRKDILARVARLLIVKDNTVDARTEDWLTALAEHPLLDGRLQCCHLTARKNVDKALHKAVLCGLPFILAGKDWPAVVDRNPELTPLLNDHAYWWILSAGPADDKRHLSWGRRDLNPVAAALAEMIAFPSLLGLSQGMRKVREQIRRLAQFVPCPGMPVLLLGETGAGKEEVAAALATLRGGPLGAFACGTLPRSGTHLSEVFGVAPGAFPQVEGRPGLLETCTDGTVFLDEFHDAPSELQGALKRVISTPKGQPHWFTRIGDMAVQKYKTTAWLVFATNRSPRAMLRDRELAPDFMRRFEDRFVTIPPLRERPADIPILAWKFWQEMRTQVKFDLHEMLPSDLAWLCDRDRQWPGNARALRAFLWLALSRANRDPFRSRPLLASFAAIPGEDVLDWVGIPPEPGPAPPPTAPVPAAPPVDEPLRQAMECLRDMRGLMQQLCAALAGSRAAASQAAVPTAPGPVLPASPPVPGGPETAARATTNDGVAGSATAAGAPALPDAVPAAPAVGPVSPAGVTQDTAASALRPPLVLNPEGEQRLARLIQPPTPPAVRKWINAAVVLVCQTGFVQTGQVNGGKRGATQIRALKKLAAPEGGLVVKIGGGCSTRYVAAPPAWQETVPAPPG